MIGIIWSIYWWHFSYERPAIHPKISESERIYIEESIGESSSIANKVIYYFEFIIRSVINIRIIRKDKV